MIAKAMVDWRWIAPVCGLLAAVGYTATNICLRSVTHVDASYVAFVRSVPTLVFVLPLVLLRVARGQSLIAPRWHVIGLLVAGIFTQMFGNVLFQWSLGVIGLALSVPLIFGSMIIGSALIGSWVLHEPINRATMGAIALLLIAVTVLAIGARNGVEPLQVEESLRITGGPWGWTTLAVIGNVVSGFAYAALATVMRRGMKAGMSTEMTLLLLSVVGIVSLGTWSFWWVGPSYMLNVGQGVYATMLAAGALNALSFYCLATALQHLKVVYVYIINASQVAMASFAGVLIFAEPITAYLLTGISFTAVGLLLPAYSSLSGASERASATRRGRDSMSDPE